MRRRPAAARPPPGRRPAAAPRPRPALASPSAPPRRPPAHEPRGRVSGAGARRYERPPLALLPIIIGEHTNEITAALAHTPAATPRGKVSPRGAASPRTSGGGDGPAYEQNFEPLKRTIKLAGDFYTEAELSNWLAMLPAVPVAKLDAAVDAHLERFWQRTKAAREGGTRPAAWTAGQTVRETVERLLDYQAIRMESMGKKPALEHAVRSVLLQHLKLRAEEQQAEMEESLVDMRRSASGRVEPELARQSTAASKSNAMSV